MGLRERVKKGTRVCLAMGIGVTALMSALVLAFGRQAFSAINSDPGVLDLGVQIISVTVPFYFVYLILEVLGGTIRGAGKAVPPMVIILTNICVLRTVLLFMIMASNREYYRDCHDLSDYLGIHGIGNGDLLF